MICKEIDDDAGEGNKASSGFNIGFDLDYWIQWCTLLNKMASAPVVSAAEMMGSREENFMRKQPKLRYTKGNVWLFLKAETKDNSERLLAVS